MSLDKIQRVAIYLRKSRNKDGEESEETLANHKKRLLDIAQKNNWRYEVFAEVGNSMDKNRPMYQEMLSKLQENLFDAVLSINLARVTRDDAETPRFMSLLRQEDILFITDSERIYNLEVQEDWQALKFTGFVNNWEYENIKAQLRKGKIDSAKQGKWSNGTPNYGYNYNRLERTLEIDEEKAKAVKLAFQLVIDGVGVDEIAITLNKLGYRTNKNNTFYGAAITRMIRSSIYKGTIESNKTKGRNIYQGKLRPKEEWIIINNAHPSIVDEKTWSLANEALDERQALSPVLKKRMHGLSGLLRCAFCGRTHTIALKDAERNYRVFQPCRTKDPFGVKCVNKGIKYDTVMGILIESIEQKKNEIIKELNNLKSNTNPLLKTKEIKQKNLESQIKKCRKALDILQLQLEEELIDLISFKERRKQRLLELESFEKELKSISAKKEKDAINEKTSYAALLDYFLKNWQDLNDSDLNIAFRKIITQLTWERHINKNEPGKIEIIWKS
ncbi:recombinase family protein [Bacillus pumilus]|uniref:recombinase family protein n=1 Tax=Bacillus safensis TaxID=561879 RepID=UPI003834CF83|nr:recombinase family protein [Bacillus pumilus]